MQQNIYKVEEITEKGEFKAVKESKELPSSLKGTLAILSPENSEIAKKLSIIEKGVYSVKRR